MELCSKRDIAFVDDNIWDNAADLSAGIWQFPFLEVGIEGGRTGDGFYFHDPAGGQGEGGSNSLYDIALDRVCCGRCLLRQEE